MEELFLKSRDRASKEMCVFTISYICDTTKNITLHMEQTCILQYSKYEYTLTSFQVINSASAADLQTNY